MFICDDYDEVYKTQPDRCIIAPAFEVIDEGSENDTFLKDLIPKLEALKSAEGKEATTNVVRDINGK